MTVGLLPAAGLSQRWGGGFCKELLPIGKERWLLDTTLQSLAHIGCTSFVLVVHPDKLPFLSFHIDHHCADLDITYVLGQGDSMWNDILRGLEVVQDEDIILRMPDTLVSLRTLIDPMPNTAIKFGLFETNQPQRFSVLCNGRFDKGMHIPVKQNGEVYFAWGSVSWQKDVTGFFLKHTFTGFDEAFNAAKEHYKESYYQITRYTDFASFDDYKSYIQGSRT